MAYLDLAQAFSGEAPAPGEEAAATPAQGLSALEWSVVALARRDRVSSLAEPSRVSLAMGRLFGTHRNPRLADPRLEALRRLAVLAWHHGYVVPKSELKRFFSAGFTPDQFETLLKSISGARASAGRRGAR